MLIGLSTYAAPVAPSPGRWEPDAERALRAESAWVLQYLQAQPRTGDHISTGLYLALAEHEDAWAAAYLTRQHAALAQAAARIDPQINDDQHEEIYRSVERTLQHYQTLVASGQSHANAFALLLQDHVGPQLRKQALHALYLGKEK
jgi:hypothetical protein